MQIKIRPTIINYKRIVLMMSILFMIFSISFADAQNNQPKELNSIFEFKIHPKMLPFQFKLIWQNKWSVVKTIEVYRADESKPFQTLKARMDEKPFENAKYFQAEDINFDGYKDIKLLIMWGATGNLFYDYYIYDTDTDKFVFSEAISNLSNPIPNPDKKELEVYTDRGSAGKVYTKQRFKLKGQQPVEVWQEIQEWKENNIFIKITKELQDGKLVIIKKEEYRSTD